MTGTMPLSGNVLAKPATRHCGGVWLFLFLCILVFPILAEQTKIHDARTLLSDGVFRLSAHVDIHLNETVREALDNGVPLLIELQIEVIRKRDWTWPVTEARLSQRFGLEYHALSQQYIVENYSSGIQPSFRELDDALEYIGDVYDLPFIDEKLLKPAQKYQVRMRAKLDIDSLPTPIRLWAYIGSDWSLDSDWYQWRLNP